MPLLRSGDSFTGHPGGRNDQARRLQCLPTD